MQIFKLLSATGVAIGLALSAGCASPTDPSEAFQGETEKQIFVAGEEALIAKNYGQAIKRFEALDVQYPYGKDTELSQLHIIYAYYMNSDFLPAVSAADRFIHSHPTNPHADYAYYMRGLSNYFQTMGIFERLFAVDFATRDLTQVKKSFDDFNAITQRFPESHYANAAHQYTVYLRNVLARHQLEVSRYYYSRKAYIAAINRANSVVQHYQGAPTVPDALVVLVKAYRALGLTQDEKSTIAVLQANYPNTAYLKSAL